MNRYRLLFKSSLVIALVLTLAVLLTGSAAAETDSYMGISFHPFTLDGSNNTCVDFFDVDIGQTRNCDPVNLVFPGRTWTEVRDMLVADDWSLSGGGSSQGLHYDDGAGPYVEDEQLFKPGTLFGPRYHIRLWQAPGDILVTFAAVHHEDFIHNIDMDWEQAEINTASALCGPDCEQTGELVIQVQIQGDDELWRSWWNNGSATVIPAAASSNEPPIASFTFNCDGLTCAFDASGSSDPDGMIVDYAWDFGDDNGDSGSDPTTSHTYSTAGIYNVMLTVIDNENAMGTDNQSVTVNEANYLPFVAFSVSCSALSCSFDASASYDPDGTIVDYAWDFGNGYRENGSATTTSYTYATAGTYSVVLTVTDNDGGMTADSQNMTVVDAPASAVHVGDLEGTSIVKKNWQAEVTITVHDNNEALAANATVSGAWSGGTTRTAVCITGEDGRCTVISAEIPKKSTDYVIFSVTGVQYGQMAYDQLANHDPQGNSSGTVIQINKDGTTLNPGQLPGEVISLSAVGYKVKGVQYVDLTWSGISNENVNIYRDGESIMTQPSGTTSYTDNLEVKRGGPYLYQVCEASTAVCSETVNVSF